VENSKHAACLFDCPLFQTNLNAKTIPKSLVASGIDSGDVYDSPRSLDTYSLEFGTAYLFPRESSIHSSENVN